MYKIKYDFNVKEVIQECNINEVELSSLIQQKLRDREVDSNNVICLVDINGKQVAVIGIIKNNEVIINHISTSPIVVDVNNSKK